MDKSPLMLRTEARIGEDLEDFLRREYHQNGRSTVNISEQVGVSASCISNWLEEMSIYTRSKSRSNIKKNFGVLSRNELNELYIKLRMSASEVGRQTGHSKSTVLKWLRRYGIQTRSISETRSPPQFTEPTKEWLEIRYFNQRQSLLEIADDLGRSETYVRKLLVKNNIPIRSLSESKLPVGFNKPTKEDLKKWYLDDGMSKTEIGMQLGVSNTCVSNWLNDYGILNRSYLITSKEQFLQSIVEEPGLRNLAAIFVLSDGEGGDVEQIIGELYKGRFSSHEHLHRLLEENTAVIYDLIRRGLTSLGLYIGGYIRDDKSILPILLGQAVEFIPDNKITATLEDRLIRLLRSSYGPRFNDNPEFIISELKDQIASFKGRKRELYSRLLSHYAEVLNLMDELK